MQVPNDSTKVEKRLFRMKEACQYLNLQSDVVRDMVRRRQLKAIRRPGLRTAWLFDKRELDRWIEQNSVTHPGPRR